MDEVEAFKNREEEDDSNFVIYLKRAEGDAKDIKSRFTIKNQELEEKLQDLWQKTSQ